MTWKPLPDRESVGPPVKASLEHLAKKFGMPSTDTSRALFERWPEAVGPLIAEHSRPLALRNEVLRVVVDDSQWLTQLKWVSPKVLERLNEGFGATVVEKIELRLE